MATEAKLTDMVGLEHNRIPMLDKSGWTELQHLQYILKMWDGVPGSPVKLRELPEWNWVPNDEWRKLEGILSDHPEHDTTEMKRREREFELEHDARKFA